MSIAHVMRIAALLFACLLTAGCSYEKVTDINGRITSPEMITKRPPDALYIVDPPDVIRVEFFSEPTLTRTVQVRQDGTITLPHVEEVHVAGMSPLQITEKLEGLYSDFYREAKLLVTVEGYHSKKVFVYGEVGREGQVSYTGYQTVTDVIGEVGGVTRRAHIGRVRVIRGDPDDPDIFKVNLKQLVLKGDTRQNVSLAENDVLYVPPTPLAWVGYRIEALLFPIGRALGLYGAGRQISE